MNIMVVGGGGREHALVKALRKSPKADVIWALPGNGGMENEALCVPIAATDLSGICAFAESNPVDLAVIGPDDPLILGLTDLLEARGIPCFGPNAAAARIEGSKLFAKRLMEKYNIPTAGYAEFSDPAKALSYLDAAPLPIVVKADGPALGKGVTVALTREEARDAVRAAMEDKAFGESGSRIVIEEYLTGPEVSLMAFTDGKAIAPLPPATDHKRAFDGDRGPNTGGMGVVAPSPFYTQAVAEACKERIFLPTLRAMNAEGCPFKGCLYFGLMLTSDGPKVIEYNCRFGDPETQAVLPLLGSDLLDILLAVTQGRLAEAEVSFMPGFSCCVVLASQGYPGAYKTGFSLELPQTEPWETLYTAGVHSEGGALTTSGGRVLHAVATGSELSGAICRAYALAGRVSFENAYFRRDIGKSALEVLR
ncbi:MAG: phosphoribosylamine--glycine ligase [Clostridiaceae bacterium]